VSRQRCTIAGCGPNLYDSFERINWDELVIVCNAAIVLVAGHETSNWIWFVEDNGVVDLAWFDHYHALYKSRLYGSAQVAERVEVGHQYEENPWFTWGDYALKPGVYRGGGSVVGCGMQWADEHGYDSTLCGVDMAGSQSISHINRPVYAAGHWNFKKACINALIAGPMPNTRTISRTELVCKPL